MGSRVQCLGFRVDDAACTPRVSGFGFRVDAAACTPRVSGLGFRVDDAACTPRVSGFEFRVEHLEFWVHAAERRSRTLRVKSKILVIRI